MGRRVAPLGCAHRQLQTSITTWPWIVSELCCCPRIRSTSSIVSGDSGGEGDYPAGGSPRSDTRTGNSSAAEIVDRLESKISAVRTPLAAVLLGSVHAVQHNAKSSAHLDPKLTAGLSFVVRTAGCS